MSDPIHLYVSSSSDLAAEREVIGQIVAALHVTLGWRISHTPVPGPLEDMIDIAELDARIRECDLYAVILGQDLTAPMGYEVRNALTQSQYHSGAKLVGAYRKDCTRSPSAREAARTLKVEWLRYADLQSFGARFKRDLIKRVLDEGPDLGLVLADVALLLRDQRADEPEPQAPDGDTSSEIAGRGGRIIGREVWGRKE
jgi:hypothetical protein